MPACRAPAKINLALAIGPPIPRGFDNAGYHPIATWMTCVDLYDDIIVRPALTPTVAIDWAPDAERPTPIDWPVEKDLAVRAIAALAQHVKRDLTCELTVHKRIPVGGGLGGGSSDAASALIAANSAFDLRVSPERLRMIGATLGSDVPFFIDDHARARPALVTGLGDRIERTPTVRGGVILIMPALATNTGAVYRAFDALTADSSHALREHEVSALARDAAPDDLALFNDLAIAAMSVEPRLADAHELAESALGVPVHITGSGACMFALDRGVKDAAIQRCRDAMADSMSGAAVLRVGMA